MNNDERQRLLDLEHLRLLRLGYLISGWVNAVWALFPLIHITLGLVMMFGSFPFDSQNPGPSDARFVGIFFLAIGVVISAIFGTAAVLKLIAARKLGERRAKTFILVVAALSCLGIPYGTALGVFTFLVLQRPSVDALFQHADSGEAGTAV
jgi:hypothetical protein